jgi:hypothetical protein
MMREPHEGMSAFWRKNTSPLEAVELANLIRALRKVVGHLGSGAPGVEYAGMAGGGSCSIVVDPSQVMGAYPVPPGAVDLLAGEVVHEALLGMEWSERVWKNLEPCCAAMEGICLIKFQKIVKTAEDIYVDSILEGSMLGEYVAVARHKVLHGSASRAVLSKSGASFDALILHWWDASFQEQVPFVLEARHDEVLSLLLGLTEELRRLSGNQTGTVAQCALRSGLYKELWKKIAPKVSDLVLIDRRLSWVPGHQQSTLPDKRLCAPQALRTRSLPAELLCEIEAQLATTTADITPLIRRAAGSAGDDVIPTSRWDYTIPAHPVVDHLMASRIGAVFRAYSTREALVSRGLPSGKIDARRLHRAPVTGRCFKHLDSRPAMDWNVTLLIDGSGSMRGRTWRLVENMVSTLHRALSGYRNSLSAYAYFEADGICMISSLIKDSRVLSVPPSGQTASGQAIIAAALFMPKTVRHRLLIHITDGESNYGVGVSVGIGFCREQGIDLVTLGCGCKDQKAMQAQYGTTIEFIGGFGVLPQAIERLLRRTFLYRTGSMPGKASGRDMQEGR